MGRKAADQQFIAQMSQLVGRDSAKLIQSTMAAAQSRQGNWISAVVGIALVLVGATSVFAQLQDSLNEIWRVRAAPERSGLAILAVAAIPFAMVLTIGFLMLVSLVLTTALSAMVHRWDGVAVASPRLMVALDLIVALAVVTVLFALLFKVLPDVILRWGDVWRSAFLTAMLFSGGRFLIALYLSHSTVASVYGAAASLVALLVWVYYSCAIFFFGVEFTRAALLAEGLPVLPKKTAVAVQEN